MVIGIRVINDFFNCVKSNKKTAIHLYITILVSILLLLIFYLPEELKLQYVLRKDSNPITLLSNHYIHLDFQHLIGNLAGFLMFSFLILCEKKKIPKSENMAKIDKLVLLSHPINLILVPIIISCYVINLPFKCIFGFSGIVFAYLGYYFALNLITMPEILLTGSRPRYWDLKLLFWGLSFLVIPFYKASPTLIIDFFVLLLFLPFLYLFFKFRRQTTLKNSLLVFLKLQVPVLMIVFSIIYGIFPENLYYGTGIRVGVEIHYLGLLFGVVLCNTANNICKLC